MATITSLPENSFIFDTVLDGGDYDEYGEYGYESESFLGAIVTDGSVGNFEWVTGEPFVYTNFSSPPGWVRENVLEMGGFFGSQWNDEDGPGSHIVIRQAFVIEHPIPEPASLLLLVTGGLALIGRGRLRS